MTGSLSGWRVLVPRPADRGADLCALLAAEDAEPVSVPLISMQPVISAEFDRAIGELAAGAFGWLGVTSAQAVSSVRDRATALGIDPLLPGVTRVAAVGAATARALREAGLRADLVAAGAGSGVDLVRSWPDPAPGDRVLLPQSQIARQELSDGLRGKGFDVRTVIAYRTVPRPPEPQLSAELAAGGFDAVLLTSPSTVTALPAVHPDTVVVVIGPTTAAAARAAGLNPHCVADQPSARGLTDALVRFSRSAGRPLRTRGEV